MPESESLASRWRAVRGKIVELPSGRSARLIQSIDLRAAIKAGFIPNPLNEAMRSMIEDGDNSRIQQADTDVELAKQLDEFLRDTVISAFVDPKVYLPPDDLPQPALWLPEDENGISWLDLTADDRAFVYQYATGGTDDLKTFREQQRLAVATVADEPEVRDEAERVSESE